MMKGTPNFKGVFAVDDTELEKTIGANESGIVNLAERVTGGSHWVCYYNSDELPRVIYFDSYGLPPDPRVERYLQTSGKDIVYNTTKIQDNLSMACGYYCKLVIKLLNKGYTYLEIILKFKPFDEANNETILRTELKKL